MDIRTEYTLEKHLNRICQDDTDYKILNSIWILNKLKLETGLNTISSNFPHYSLHDSSHSKTIIKNIECLLGEDRISTLGATETFLLLMGSYTHDIGMVLFHDVIHDEWNKKEFKDNLEWIIEYSSDKDLKDAATIILQPLKEKDPEKDLTWALDVRNAVTVVVADYFRGNHHERGRDYIAQNSTFKSLADNFYSQQLPARFFKLLAKVAYGHGTDFYKIMNDLAYQENGLKSDKIHPKFIAAMIRMGDLLDVDDGRFNQFSIRTLNKMPDTSLDHLKKHASVTHLLISPQSIEVTVDCPSDSVYRQARLWFDGLIKEVQLLSKEWISVAPENLGGLPPVILNDRIQILYEGKQTTEELRNLKFAISNERIFEMLEGGALYEDADFVFLREMVQNALDASKIQLWKDIQSGIYDFALIDHLGIKNKDGGIDYAKHIKFPDDIPDNIYAAYPIKLSIKWVDKDKCETIEITCEDKGTGISNNDLVRMTSHVGESRKADKEFANFKESMPYWLKPTGAFGVGLQSLFLVTDSFTIETKADSENEAKEIIFRSAKRNAYCSASDFDGRKRRGSKARLLIYKDKFDINKKSDSYDYFTDTRGGKYPHLLLDYIYLQFKEIDNMELDFLDDGSTFLKTNKTNNVELSIPEIYNEHYKISYYYDDEKSLIFIIDENKFGSRIKFKFLSELINRFRSNNNNLYLKNIPLEKHFLYRHFFDFDWNLLNSDSDKIVGLSRVNVLQNHRYDLGDQFNNIVKDVLPNLYQIFINNYKDISLEKIQKHFVHFHLACSLLEYTDFSIDNLKLDLFKNELLPQEIALTHDKKQVPFNDFFKLEEIITYQDRSSSMGREFSPKKEDLEYTWLSEYYIINNIYSKETIIHDSSFLTSYKYVKNTNKKFIPIEMNKNVTLANILVNRNSILKYNFRFLYPLKEYEDICVKRDEEYNLISPFKNRLELYDFNKDMEPLDSSMRKSKIKEKYIPQYITETLINYIIENQAEKKPITRDEILKTYERMLNDICEE